MSEENKTWYNIVISEDGKNAEIFIYEEIGFWGVTAREFIRDFKAIEANDVDVHINSPGGSVFDGIAIYNILRTSSKNINVIIDGLAASIASIIAMGGNTVKMADNALFMIHNPLMWTFGEVKDLEKDIQFLNQIKEQLITTYANKTGIARDKISEMMDEETWLDATEAKEQGFIDEIIAGQKAAALFDLKKYEFKNEKAYDKKKILEKNNEIHAKKKTDVKITTEIKNKEQIEDQIMNLEELKNKHPELYNELFNLGKKDGIAEGEKTGVKNEGARINGINALNIVGHDEIIKNALADGESDKKDVALAVMQANTKATALVKKKIVDESDEVEKVENEGAAGDEGAQSKEKIEAEAKAMADSVNKDFE